MANASITVFPSQSVSNKEKASMEFGQKVSRAIESEWYNRDAGRGRFQQQQTEFHRLRNYARGEQSTQIYKDRMSVDGDLSYVNLDWRPVHIMPKFIDIVVNGMQDRLFHVKAIAQDAISTEKRIKYVEDVMKDMATQDILDQTEQQLGISLRNVPREELPGSRDELELHMQIGYKQAIEIAQEQAIENVFMSNKFHETKKRIDYDLTVLGIGAAKHSFNGTDGITIDYVDPANLVYSYTEDPNFEDCYYFGEVKRMRLAEIKKIAPHLTDEELRQIGRMGQKGMQDQTNYADAGDEYDTNTVDVLFFNFKTYESDTYKVKQTVSGGYKALKRDDSFMPPKDSRAKFEKVEKINECIYEGISILGCDKLIKWQKAKNMVRPESNANKVMMNYIVSAPRLYKGRIESLAQRMVSYVDMIQLTHLKLQQAVQKMTPSGVYIDADGLVEIDLGNGTSYSPKEALNMYLQTGSVIGRSLTSEGDVNPGKIPIQELPGGGGQQIQHLVGVYNYYLNGIRDVTGLNEARDGSDPDPNSLVGVQKLAAANSNTATRHILHGSMYITTALAECISVRFKDVMEFHPQREKFIGAIGKFSVGALKELDNLHLHDFGIFLELEPDEEEKQMLEQNIQVALSKDSIYLEDANDIRQINNIKLANQLLKFRRKQKMDEDQRIAQENLRAQSEAQANQAQATEMAKAQAEQIKTQAKQQLAKVESILKQDDMSKEVDKKKELMAIEFQYNQILKTMEIEAQRDFILLQQSNARQMAQEKNSNEIDKAKINTAAKAIKGPVSTGKPQASFESSGNDVMNGKIGLSSFDV